MDNRDAIRKRFMLEKDLDTSTFLSQLNGNPSEFVDEVTDRYLANLEPFPIIDWGYGPDDDEEEAEPVDTEKLFDYWLYNLNKFMRQKALELYFTQMPKEKAEVVQRGLEAAKFGKLVLPCGDSYSFYNFVFVWEEYHPGEILDCDHEIF